MRPPGTLRGMAWDHPRARDPLAAVSAAWSKSSGIAVNWDARPLKAFEDQPLEDLARAYDLVLMDYPFVGTAAASGLIVPVNDWVDARYLADQAANSVGPSYASYTWAGKQWALAIDAATQVSAHRADLADAAGVNALPASWPEVADLARATPAAPSRVAIPLNPNHAYCAFLSVGLSLVGPKFWPKAGRVDESAALESLNFLQNLARDLHPISKTADPIAVSDRMTGTGEILYVPLMFGYSNYARAGFRQHVLRFGNAPVGSVGTMGKGTGSYIGSVLGGVGIALSAQSQNPEAAADLARTLVSAETQSGLYVSSGGQPGHAAAWDSDVPNQLVGNFFRDTRETMRQAFLRPRVPGHRRFQELAGELIHDFIWGGTQDTASCLAAFNRLADELLGDWEAGNVLSGSH